jgi:ABC-2 type transport system permease protein
MTFAPSPGAARIQNMVLAQAAMETRLLMRNGEQILLALVIPVVILIGGTASAGVVELGSGRRIDVLTPGVLALAVLSTAFNSLAIATGFERRYGVLKRLGATPLPRSGLLAGKVLAVFAVEAVQLVVIAAVALALSWQPEIAGVSAAASTVLLVICGTAAFASWGLLIAGTLRAEATLAAANLIYVLLVTGGAVVIPLGEYPNSLQPVVRALPSGALSEGLRSVLTGGAFPGVDLLVLILWAAAGTLLCTRVFRWE